jgi:hypothetical protein
MTSKQTDFQTFMEEQLPLGSDAGPAEMKAVLDKLGITDPDALTLALGAVRDWGDESDTLSFSPSGWRIKLSSKIGQSFVMGTVLWAALVQAGVANIPTIIAAVLPVLFDFERVKLTWKEESVLVRLALYDHNRTKTPEEWYQELPPEIQEELGMLEFLDILEKIVGSGSGRKHDSEIEIFRSGEGRLALKVE